MPIDSYCDLTEPETLSYWKDVLQVAFMSVALVWLLHSLITGNKTEIKKAVNAG